MSMLLKATKFDLLATMAAETASEPEGSRNPTLYARAHRALRAGFSAEDVRDALTPAAIKSGLPRREAQRILDNAIADGEGERLPDGTPPMPPSEWADVWAKRHPRIIGTYAHNEKGKTKYAPAQPWQTDYPWTEPNRPVNVRDGVGVVIPPGLLVADVDGPAAFAATGLEFPAGAPTYTSISGVEGKRHVWMRLHPDRPYPTRAIKSVAAGLDVLVGGSGYVNIPDEAAMALIGDPESMPFVPDWLQPPVGNPLGTVTADMLPSGPPPPMIADGWLHPEEGTILYGKGGTGKGITTAYLISLLVAEGHEVLILDYENHPREWGTRLTDLEMGPARKHVHYLSPFGRAWTGQTGTIDAIADIVRRECDRLGITFLVVDSYTAASDASSDSLGGQEAAQAYARAMVHIGRPHLVLAHVNGTQQRHPERPFGSVFVHNYVGRRSWSVEEHEAPIAAGADPRTMPAYVSLEFRNQKHNDVARVDDRYLQFGFYPEHMEVKESANAKRTIIDMVRAVLRLTPLLTIKQVRTAIKAEFQQDVSEDSISKAIQRASDVLRDESKVPYHYSVETL